MATTLEAGSSRSVDDFLKKVFLLQEEERRVSTNELAKALAISAASITDMAQRLRDAGLIDYRRYYGRSPDRARAGNRPARAAAAASADRALPGAAAGLCHA